MGNYLASSNIDETDESLISERYLNIQEANESAEQRERLAQSARNESEAKAEAAVPVVVGLQVRSKMEMEVVREEEHESDSGNDHNNIPSLS